MPAAARDLQADRVGHARAERARLGGGLVDRDPHRHALAHLAHRLQAVRRLLDELEAGGGRAPRSPRTASSTLHAPLASRRSAICGPAAARAAATRPASSPTPTFSLMHVEALARRRARPARRRPRGRARRASR